MRIVLSATFLAILFLVAIPASGQTRRTNRPRTPAVIAAPAATPAPAPATALLSIEAGIVYLQGGAQAVARVDFILLDIDLMSILATSDLRSRLEEINASSAKNGYGLMSDKDLITILAVEYKILGQSALTTQVHQIIKGHTISVVTTDFGGKAQFTDIKPAKYFIFAHTQTRKGVVIWNLPIELKAGQNTAVLDQNNAAHVD